MTHRMITWGWEQMPKQNGKWHNFHDIISYLRFDKEKAYLKYMEELKKKKIEPDLYEKTF